VEARNPDPAPPRTFPSLATALPALAAIVALGVGAGLAAAALSPAAPPAIRLRVLGAGAALLALVTAALLAALLQRTQRLRALSARLEDHLAAQARVARHDPLTGLLNREAFQAELDAAVGERRAGRGGPFAVVVLNLDRLNRVNESLGQAQGDRLLRATADRIRVGTRAGDEAARLAGGEFAILLRGVIGEPDALAAVERLREQLGAPLSLGGQDVFPSARMGVAPWADHYRRGDRMLYDAVTAMEHSRDLGRGQVAVFRRSMQADAERALRLEGELRLALQRGELVVHYQPIVSLRDRTIAGFEALVRWNHPHRGLVPPLEFIPVAEESGLIVPLGAWVLRAACRQFAEWNARGGCASFVSVNLSARQFAQADLVESVAACLRETGLDPAALKLELTEGVVMGDAERTVHMLDALKRLGLQLCVDDFGTGYSSLSYLQRFPLDGLKIDRSFVRALGESDGADALVRGIVSLARGLGLSVVAEGVESEGQAARLLGLGCDYAQGYLFARPLPADLAEALVVPASRVRQEDLH
jgi:diguanylate cyclase (GGDEF)-like protein